MADHYSHPKTDLAGQLTIRRARSEYSTFENAWFSFFQFVHWKTHCLYSTTRQYSFKVHPQWQIALWYNVGSKPWQNGQTWQFLKWSEQSDWVPLSHDPTVIKMYIYSPYLLCSSFEFMINIMHVCVQDTNLMYPPKHLYRCDYTTRNIW